MALNNHNPGYSLFVIRDSRRGFTLIEIIIVIAVGVIVFGFAAGVGSDFYANQRLIAERDNILNLLRRARTKAMNNINQSDHGLFIASTSYSVFEGSSYAARDQNFDETFPRLAGVTISGPTEVVFTALEGASNTSGTISIASGKGQVNILVNYEGRISW